MGLGLLPDAAAHQVVPGSLHFGSVGEQSTFIVTGGEGDCSAEVDVSSSNPNICTVTPDGGAGSTVRFTVTATGVGTAFIDIHWIGVDPCQQHEGFDTLAVTVGPFPLIIELCDSTSLLPIPSGRVYIERANVPTGFNAFYTGDSGGAARFESPAADVEEYLVEAIAPGYMRSGAYFLTPGTSSSPVLTIYLVRDTDLSYPNTLRVMIDLLLPDGSSSGDYLLTNRVRLIQNSSTLDNTPIFGRGEMIFIGVPPGTITVSVPNTTNYTFSSAMITLGTGEDRSVIVTGTINTSENRSGVFPGSIVGTVTNSSVDPPTGIEDAQIFSTQDGLGVSTYTWSRSDGTFFFPSVTTGTGIIYGVSEDGTIEGPSKPVLVVAGYNYGYSDDEDTELEIPLEFGSDDTDADGLPDSFESEYFEGVSDDEQGPLDDPDGDGLTNLEEYLLDTSPILADTDEDGYDDGVEKEWGTDGDDKNDKPDSESEVWLDFGFADDIQAGTLMYPVSTISDGLWILQESGGTIKIKGDVPTTTGSASGNSINDDVTLDAVNGTITLDDE
jgi:hypothetical protein